MASENKAKDFRKKLAEEVLTEFGTSRYVLPVYNGIISSVSREGNKTSPVIVDKKEDKVISAVLNLDTETLKIIKERVPVCRQSAERRILEFLNMKISRIQGSKDLLNTAASKAGIPLPEKDPQSELENQSVKALYDILRYLKNPNSE